MGRARLRGWLLFLPAAQAGVAAADQRFFVERIYPVLEKAAGRPCHTDNGVSSVETMQSFGSQVAPSLLPDARFEVFRKSDFRFRELLPAVVTMRPFRGEEYQ